MNIGVMAGLSIINGTRLAKSNWYNNYKSLTSFILLNTRLLSGMARHGMAWYGMAFIFTVCIDEQIITHLYHLCILYFVLV